MHKVRKKKLCPKPHYHRKKPLRFAGIDIETAGNDNNQFICACIFSEDFRLVFYSKQDLFDELKKHQYRKYKFVATNLEFDFFGSFQGFDNHLDMMERNSRIYRATLYQQADNIDGRLIRRKPIHFFDTLNYAPLSVEKLGKIVGIPKIDHPYFFPRRPKNDVEMQILVDYCMNDAMISYAFMTNIIAPWLEEQGITFKMTIAGVAMEDFTTNYLTKTLWVEDEATHKICFNGYYGGRTEVFRRGKFKRVFCYDVNSLYPTAMLEEIPNPNSSRKMSKCNEHILMNYEGVAEFKVHVPEDINIPPLPYREKKGDKLIFPVGTFKGYYTFVEIRNALRYGVKILSYGKGVYYNKKERFFKKFVETHFDRRKVMKHEGNPREIMEKGVMNNLYGKFALNYMESSSIQHKSKPLEYSEDILRTEPRGDYILIVKKNCIEAPDYSFPIMSAYITSYARIIMYEILNKYQDKVLYTDTDSIFMTEPMESSEELGGFKLEEGYPAREIIFIRPKVYKVIDEKGKTKIKCKGMSGMKDDEFGQMLDGKELKQRRFLKHRSAFATDREVNSIYTIPKNISLEDEKRIWKHKFNPNGQEESTPIILGVL